LIVAVITSCGGNSGNKNKGTAAESASVGKDAVNITVESAFSGKIDLADNSNFFIVADGVKYGVNTTFQNLVDAGFEFLRSVNFSREYGAGNFSVNQISVDRNDITQFAVTPINRSNKPAPLSECTIYHIKMFDVWYKNVKIVGDITFGYTVEEVEEVFGTNPSYKTTNEERKKQMGGETIAGDKNDVIMSYKKPGPNTDGQFTFYFDPSGKLNSIIMESNK
jgi:hypothetical protein